MGEGFTAANGQQVPSTLTYTDAAGDKTHYVAANQIAKLLDAEVEWRDETQSVEFAPGGSYSAGDVILTVGEEKKPEDRIPDPDLVTAPEYGKIVGGLGELDPATTPFINDVYYRCGGKAQDLRMQVHLDSSRPLRIWRKASRSARPMWSSRSPITGTRRCIPKSGG